MRRPAAALALALILPATAMAADAAPESLREAFGNTIVSTYPDGRTGKLWLKADGSYTAAGRRGDPSNGTWKVKGAKVCLRQKRPASVPISFCTPIPNGAEWSAKAVTGEKIRVKVVKGRA